MILLVSIWKRQRVNNPIQHIIFTDMKNYCVKIVPYVDYYKKQIDYYNWTAYEIITNECLLLVVHCVFLYDLS